MEWITDYLVACVYAASAPLLLEAWGYIKEENRPYQDKLMKLYQKGGRKLEYKDVTGRKSYLGRVFNENRSEFNPVEFVFELFFV